ncbi:MAG: GxxExxY protein [Novosphingobium sp.]|nr:GxxExxY protein [Novosphingobium sp.]
MLDHEEIDRLARIAVHCGFEIHRDLGPGLLESAYEAMMFASLREAGCHVERQVAVPLIYKGTQIDVPFRADLVVEGKLLIELKSVERAAPVHAKQVLTYLRLMNLPLGLLINFGMASFKLGVQRIANDFRDR